MPGERMVIGMPPDKVTELPPELDSLGILGRGRCEDFKGRWISGGEYYTPGPDSCTVCVCEKGNPKWCQAVLCAPPNDCKSFRVGNNCCEFVCLDDLAGKGGGFWDVLGGDMGLRLVASAITAVLSLALLLFLVHRLRKKRRRTAATRQEARGPNLGSLDHMSGSNAFLNRQDQVDFLGEQPPPHYVFWKPPTYTPPVGEAPPPYSEAGTPISFFPTEPATPFLQTSAVSATLPAVLPPEIRIVDQAEQKIPTENTRLLGEEETVNQVNEPPIHTLVQASVPLLASRATIDLEEATPPPSYADIIAASSSSDNLSTQERIQTTVRIRPRSDGIGLSYTVPRDYRAGRNTLTEIERDAAMQRFSLQLALDLSASSSSSLSLSPANPLISPTSSSSASSGEIRQNSQRNAS